MSWAKRIVILAAAICLVALPASAATAKDSDHDGLPNSWEKGKTPSGLNLKKLGADPKHRDVFLELDYSKQVGPSDVQCSGLNHLVKAFAGGPLQNPDGKQGIRLHIDAGKTCGSHGYDMGGSSTFKVDPQHANAGCVTPADYTNVLSANRLDVFHAGAVVADAQICGAEGSATETDFDVKVRTGGDDFAYVVMHELGHIFGLHHGLTSDVDVPIDKFSVMSGGTALRNPPDPSFPYALDYNRYPLAPLNESSLDEHTGYPTGSPKGDAYIARFYAPQYCGATLEHIAAATGPVDWNCSGAPFWVPPYSNYIDASNVSYDVNGSGVIDTLPAVPAEWPTVGQGLGNGRIGG